MTYRLKEVQSAKYIVIDTVSFVEAQSIALKHTSLTHRDVAIINDEDHSVLCVSVHTPHGVSLGLCTTGSMDYIGVS